MLDDLYKLLAEHTRQGVYIVDRERRITDWNPAAEQITGYFRQDVVGQLCRSDLLIHCDAKGRILCGDRCPLTAAIQGGHSSATTVFLRHKNGHRVPVHVQAIPIRDEAGAISGAIEIFEQEHSTPMRYAEALGSFGCLDDATGLLNRPYAETRLKQRLVEMELFGIPIGWIRIELEDLHALEHRCGPPAVDALVALAARTLMANNGQFDLLARWDTDQFRLAMYNCSPCQVREVSSMLAALISSSDLSWWGDLIHAHVSAGCTIAAPGDSVSSLEQRTAEACFTSRAHGSGCAVLL